MSTLAEISIERNKKQNQIEELKSGLDFCEAYRQIERFASMGYESIGENDKKYTLKNFGIFDRPATPWLFMLRIRIPSGRLSLESAAILAEISDLYGRGYIDITTRAQVELRYIQIEDMPKIFELLAKAGLSSFQTGVDNFRNIVCDPLCGLAYDSYIDTTDELFGMQELFLGKCEWISALPRKFNIAINGSVANRCNVFGHDLSFSLAVKDGVYGYNVYLGGKVGASAKDADIFIKRGGAPLFFDGLAKFFRDFGFRDNRNKNRLKFLIDSIGMERFRNELEEYLGVALESRGKSILDSSGGDTAGKTALKDGSFAYLEGVVSGVFSAKKLFELVDKCQKYGGHSINFTIEQNLYLLGVDDSIDKDGSNKSIFYTNVVACAGSEHCPFGVIPNKPDAIECADYLQKRFGDGAGKVRFYWSACPKGCGIHGVGDIGFVGTKVAKNREIHLGVDIYIGGSMSTQQEGKLLIKGALLGEAKEYAAEVVSIYLSQKKEDESFEEFFVSYLSLLSVQMLSFVVRINRFFRQNSLNGLLIERLNLFCAGKREEAEIYLIGFYLHEKLFGGVAPVRNIFELTKKQKLQKPLFLLKDNTVLLDVVSKMATAGSYLVFSEILGELGI